MERAVKRRSITLIAALAVFVTTSAVGQLRHVGEGFEHQLFPPDLVKQHQSEINLSAEQRAVITEAIKSFQEEVVETQWQMDEEQAKLGKMLEAATADEAQVLAQMDRVLGLEARVKRAHLGMLIRIKNTLTEEQQKQLTFHHQQRKEHEAEFHYRDSLGLHDEEHRREEMGGDGRGR
jgi:Spy/CpxP family protein refolding chaperone